MLMIKRLNIGLMTFLVCTISQSANALDMVEEVQKCATISANDERLSCYDALSQSLVDAQSEGQAVQQEIVSDATKQQESTDMADSLGGSRFVSEKDKAKPLTEGYVSFCQLSYDKKYLFVFENGQVWKQSDSKRYRLKECGFDVKISRDFFGYFMKIQGEAAGRTGKIRINRKK